MKDCKFTLNDNGNWQCDQCGWVYPLIKEIAPKRNCPNPPKERKVTNRAIYAKRKGVLGVNTNLLTRRLKGCKNCRKRRTAAPARKSALKHPKFL